MKKLKDYIVEYEIHHDGNGNYRDDEGNEWTSRTGSAHRSSFGRRHTITSHQPDHPHSVHINGKKWKTFGSHSHASNVAKKIQGATVHKESKDPGEYDQEGDMAMTQLRSIIYHAQELHDQLDKNDNLPEWVQSKITLAQDYMQTVCDYMYSQSSVKEEATCPVCKKDPCECDDSHGFVKEDNEHYHKAEEHLSKANDAERAGRMKDFHAHMADHHDAMSEWHDSKGRSASADKHADKAEMHHDKSLTVKEDTINELSSDLLARYKEKAGMAASAADKAGKYDLGHKRFKGIMKATFKQFANDSKK